MIKPVFRRNSCRLCNSTNLKLVLQLTPTPLADSYVSKEYHNKVQKIYPLDLFLCHKCGLLQLLDVIQPEDIYLNYIYVTASSLGLIEHFQKYANKVMDAINPPPGALIVDIGSNDGILLKFFKEKGMRVLGIEPAATIAKKATESGIETLPIFFTEEIAGKIKNDYGFASVVTANNLFANIDKLADFTKGVRSILAPDGVFIFESFYVADQIQNMVFDFIYHEHLSYFSVKPLDFFFRKYGMELIDVERVPTKGGSLRYTVQLAGGPRHVSASVGYFKSNEKKLKLHKPKMFKDFEARIESIKKQVTSLMQELKEKGKKIAGYGASATSTTLIYHFNLGEALSFIVDDNISRQNLFSPGYHIPVLPQQTIYEQKPDYVLILAWRYLQPILEKHQKFLNQGGHFIVPLPNLKIL